jgi:hypothetical protein
MKYVWVIEMWEPELEKWSPCADAYLVREDAVRMGLKTWRARYQDARFRAEKYTAASELDGTN